MEVGMFSYLRPCKGDADYEEWLVFAAMYYRAGRRDGRGDSEELFAECWAYADSLGSGLYAMKAGEMLVANMNEEELSSAFRILDLMAAREKVSA
jgi:hypothetical protein